MKAMVLEDPDWMADAVATIIGLSHAYPEFSADDVRRELRPAPSDKMPGAAFTAARRLGYIEGAGYTISTTTTRRHGVLRTWRRRINKGVAA